MRTPDEENEIEFEDNDDSNESLGAQSKMKKLRDQLKEAQAKRDEYLAGWQREKADAINARRELLSDADRRSERLKMALAEDLIPVLDSFDMAAGSESWSEVNDGFRAGMEAVRNQLLDVLSRHGIERFGKIGEQFDPRLHEAVQEMDDVAGQQHSIIKILRSGYKSGAAVVRPAQVIIKS